MARTWRVSFQLLTRTVDGLELCRTGEMPAIATALEVGLAFSLLLLFVIIVLV